MIPPGSDPHQMSPTTIRRSAPEHSIAAVIPLYNGARWIEQTINSVLSQTLSPDEFIIVDDGSTDSGPAIVERFAKDHPLTLLRKPNGGQSSARNFGIAHSKSALIALLDHDDIWYPNHLEVLVRPFKEDRAIPIGWVYSNVDEIDADGKLMNRGLLDFNPAKHPKRCLLDCLSHDMLVLPSASLISREAFERVGGFDERLSGYEDDDLFVRLLRSGYANVYVRESLSQFRISPDSSSHSGRMAISRMVYFEKIRQLFPTDQHHNVNYIRDVLAPRFSLWALLECIRFVHVKDRNALAAACNDLATVARHLRLGRRVQLMTFSVLGRSPRLAAALITANTVFRRLQMLYDPRRRAARGARRPAAH